MHGPAFDPAAEMGMPCVLYLLHEFKYPDDPAQDRCPCPAVWQTGMNSRVTRTTRSLNPHQSRAGSISSRTANWVTALPMYLKQPGKITEMNRWEDTIAALPFEEARRELMKLKGVGPKAADCILLFAFQKYEAFPVDVWIRRIMQQNYLPDPECRFPSDDPGIRYSPALCPEAFWGILRLCTGIPVCCKGIVRGCFTSGRNRHDSLSFG